MFNIFCIFQIEYNHEDFAQVLSEWVDTSTKSQPSLSGPGNQTSRKRSAAVAVITESVPFEGPGATLINRRGRKRSAAIAEIAESVQFEGSGDTLINRRGSLELKESAESTTEVQLAAFNQQHLTSSISKKPGKKEK